MKTILKYENGSYRWVYELPMISSFFLLAEVWRVLLCAAVLPVGIFMIISVLSGEGIKGALGLLGTAAIVFGILFVLSIPAYWIVTKANNGKYTVMFEMDDEGIDHIQIKTDKALALEKLTEIAGSASGKPGLIGQSLLQSSGGSLYSRFVKVKTAKAVPSKNLIILHGMFVRNQVYVDPEDFDFVWEYIKERCIQAKIYE